MELRPSVGDFEPTSASPDIHLKWASLQSKSAKKAKPLALRASPHAMPELTPRRHCG